MRHLRNHAANGPRIRAFDHLVQSGKPKSLNHQLLLCRRANGGAHPFEVKLAAVIAGCLRHSFNLLTYSSCSLLPRMAATSLRFFSRFSASKVALITLCGFVVPIDLVSTFCTPAEVMTARTAPPAMTPVPSGAGFSSTLPEP